MSFLSVDQFAATLTGTIPPGFAVWKPYIRPDVIATPEMYAEVALRKRPVSNVITTAKRYAEAGAPRNTFFAETNPEMLPFSGRKF